MSVAVALAWHVLAFEDLLALVRRAEALGFPAVFVDGDVSILPSRGAADVLDGWTLTCALLSRTEHIQIGSIRLAHHWNAAKLAQAVATQERITPGRLRFLASVGGHPADARFGLPFGTAAERTAHLAETLDALRALWRGEPVTRRGAHVVLDEAVVTPVPPRRIEIAVAGRAPRLLDVVAAHADVWDVNLPPIAARMAEATADLDDACRARGRDPSSVSRSMWIFTRPGVSPEDPGLRDAFRRWNPWFAAIPDAELAEGIVAGSGPECLRRFGAIRRELGIDRPIADLSGLDAPDAARALEALAPENDVDSQGWGP